MSYLESHEGTVSYRPPDRLYARVNSIEALERSAVVTFSSVDADWFDDWTLERPNTPQFAYVETPDEVERRVSVVEVEFSPRKVPLEGGWFELHLEDGVGDDASALHYLSLYGPGIPRTLASRKPIRGEQRDRLSRATSLDQVKDASAAELADALTVPEAIGAAAVYDVGQGGCNALIGESRYPLIYFDLGGGIRANARTFPPALQRFCFTRSPPIILSHFDEDHWSSANRDQRALQMTWIAPRQSLGPTHAVFARRLVINNKLLVWGDSMPPLTVGQVSVGRCTGSGMNNSGLSLVLSGPDEKRMLFPGDAKYELTPFLVGKFCSVVVAHHGGRATTSPKHVPVSDGSACGRLVYTYGPDNHCNHPLTSSERLHRAWPRVLRTESRVTGLGHVHLYWDSPPNEVHPPCGGAYCALHCRQH